MCDTPRDLSATEYEVADKLTGAGWQATRCMDAWTCFEKDGRQVLINWDSAGEIDSVEGITAAELISLMVPQPTASEARKAEILAQYAPPKPTLP